MEEKTEKQNEIAEDNNKKNSFLSALIDIKDFSFETVKIVAISLIVILAIRSYVMQPFFVSGKSMEPNFHDGDYLIVDELSYKLWSPQRGDVIIFRYPKNQAEFFIKRIIGLPGEMVEIKNNKITVYNGEHPEGLRLEENPYLSARVNTTDYSIKLNNSEYFVLGDNRTASADSRLWGPLPSRLIVGKAMVRAWPINDFTFFESLNYEETGS